MNKYTKAIENIQTMLGKIDSIETMQEILDIGYDMDIVITNNYDFPELYLAEAKRLQLENGYKWLGIFTYLSNKEAEKEENNE